MSASTLAPPRPSLAPETSKPSKLRFWFWAFLFLASSLVVSELFCRFVLGLGDPPLFQADRTMEFLLQPSRAYRRFHNRFLVNQYSMRADDFPPRKSSPDELRVLVVGDSIVYGGVRIDQADISTEILKRNLQREFARPVVVGNSSVKGWGPPDELGYLKRYGTLDADVVIFELSSHDYEDAPQFAPLVGISPAYPDKKPPGALADLFETYFVPRYLHRGSDAPAGDMLPVKVNATPSARDIAQCRAAERELYFLARSSHAKVALVQHLSTTELEGQYLPGYYANQAVAKELGVPYVDDADDLRARLKSGENPFYEGDLLHLNRSGQEPLANALQRAVHRALDSN